MAAEEEQAQLKRELSAERAKCARLEGELARERAENASLRQMLEEVLRRLSEVEGQLANDSHTSSKPPSSDGPGRKRVSPHRRSEKKTGGQAGHPGHTLKSVDTPDEVVKHHVEEICCPACGQQTVGCFPAEVMAPAQYGPNVQALAVYLYQGRLQHGDETGVRIAGKRHWLHVNCTNWLTHLAWHPKRGRQAMDEIGIWPRFGGRAMRDRWASYDTYAWVHRLCGAHLLRDCIYLAEQEQQALAAEMADHLLAMHHAAHEWRLRGATCVPSMERNEWVTHYFEILVSGYAAQPPPVEAEAIKRRGRQKQSAAKNLLDDPARDGQIRCWPFSTTCLCPLRTISRRGIFGW